MKGYFSCKVSQCLALIIVYSYPFSKHSPLSQILQIRIKSYFVPLISHCTSISFVTRHSLFELHLYIHIPLFHIRFYKKAFETIFITTSLFFTKAGTVLYKVHIQ